MTDAQYFADPGLSKSRIDLLRECPARYKADIDGDIERKDSDALRFGSLCHLLTLQPELFSTLYASTSLNLATKAGKEWKASLPPNVEVVKDDVVEKAVFMADAVRSHWQCSVLFDNPHECEVPVFWERNGVRCKCKPDIVAELPDGRRIIGDLKTTESANPRHCEKSIMQWGYYRQAAWYLAGMEAAGRPCDAFVFMFVEKARPHLVTCFTMSDEALEHGLKECDEAIESLKACQVSGVWPCYVKDIQEFAWPAWAK